LVYNDYTLYKMKSLEDLQKTLDTLVTETSASYEDDDDYVTVKTIVDRTRAKKDIAVLAINLYEAVVKSLMQLSLPS